MYGNFSNGIRQLTDEQRKALAQCLAFGARPAEVLLHTKYVTLEPNGELALTAEAAQDWMKLHQSGSSIDALTGAIVDQMAASSELGRPSAWGGFTTGPNLVPRAEVLHGPFTPEQERRILKLLAEILHDLASAIEDNADRRSDDA